jgi:urea transport system substrate-binding protein
MSGTMAISEAPLVEASLMAIAQINQTGGVLGKLIEPIIEDGASDPAAFECLARKLIQRDQVTTIFGCWTSASRKAVLPVLEEFNTLLWYPVQYEGLECSKNIFYTGSCPNQQVEPAVNWLLKNRGKQFYLLGSDYVFPRTVNKLITAQLKQQGGKVVGEEYVSLGTKEFTETIARIKQVRPDVVFNTLNGDSNLAFYRQYQKSGITADEIPILAVSIAEAELQKIGGAAAGHYASWSYFQSLDTLSNQKFVQNFKHQYGSNRVTSEPIEAAYSQVYLWKQAVEQAQSLDVERVREVAIGQSFEAPSGKLTIEPNHHIARTCRIGQILLTGQFEIVFSSDNPIKPLPWLGVEELNFQGSAVVIDMLAEVSQGIHEAWQLEQKSRELEAAKAQLQREITQRQRVEAVLRDSEAQLHALFAAMNDVVLVFNTQGRFLKIAPTNLSLLYKSADQLIGKTLHEVFEKAQADAFVGYIQKALATQQTVNVEYTRPTLEKQEVWLSASISPLSEDTVIWVARDITEAKQAEKALQESEQRYRSVVDNLKEVVFQTDTSGLWTFLNPAWTEITGFSVKESLGNFFFNYVHPRDRQQSIELFQSLMECHKQYCRHEVRYLTKDAGFRWIEVYAQLTLAKDGTVIGTSGTLNDITERKLATEALQQSEERMRALVNAIPDEMFRHRVDGTFLDVKAQDWDLIVPSEMLIGKNLLDLPMPKEVKHHFLKLLQIAVETGELQTYEHELEKFDGFHSYEARIIKSGADEAVCIVRDITERKQVEKDLRQAQERYHSIFENSDEGLFQVTPDGRYLSANPALARIYGYKSPEELMTRLSNSNQQLYVDPNRRAELVALLQTQENVSNFESQIYRIDRKIIWISENTHVVRDGNGELLYYEGSVIDITERKVWEEALRYQQECTEELLLNILPSPIAQRLKRAENIIADNFAAVTVLFADLVDFTEISAQIPPTKLVDLLNRIFSRFDQLADKHGLEKIKTIGDAYMVVGGLPTPRHDHAEAVAEIALEMQQAINQFKRDNGEPFRLRIGIHSGPVVAGVIGMKKFAYDLWGDTVNVASRMESQGVAGRIQVTTATRKLLKDQYLFERRGATLVKGKGEMITYWLTGRKVCQL